MKNSTIPKNKMYIKFCLYGFLKNQRFFDPFIILFFREMGISFFEIGILFSIREISTNILEIPTGVIADAFGRRKSMIAAFASYLVSFAIFYFFPHFFSYAIAMIFFAAGEAFRSGTHKAMILEYLRIKGIEDMKVEYYGHTRSVSQFGSAISSIIAIFIVFHSKSYRPIFLLSMIPYVLGLLLMFSYPKYLDGVLKETKDGFQNSIKNKFQYTWSAFIALFHTKEALKAIFNSSTFDGFFKSSKDYLQPILKAQALTLPVLLYFTTKQRTAVIVGIIYFILYLLTSTASRKSGSFVNRMRSLPFAVNITFITGGILLLISGISTSLKLYVVAIIALILLYVVQNLRRPMNVAYISDNISHRAMASGLSVESQIKTILMAILAPIIGYLADTFGVGMAITIAAVLFLIMYPFVSVQGKTNSISKNK